MTKCFLLSILVLSSFSVKCQSYRFEATTGTYSELSGAKSISFAAIDSLSGLYRVKELDGEVFKWYNTLFPLNNIKTFHIQPYANLRFDNDSSLIIIDGAFTYLDSIDPNSSISYKIEGNPGDLLVKVQWKNLKLRVGKAGNYANVQIWVYQRSGVYEIHYGPSSSSNQTGFNTTSGPQVGIFYSLDNFTKCFEKLWVTGSPASRKLDSAANYTFRAMSGVPVEGVVYRFIPRFKTLHVSPPVNDAAGFYLYPNPVKNGVLHMSQEGNYRIYDVYGRICMDVNQVSSIDVSPLPEGVYYLFSETIGTRKFIVQAED